MWGVIVSNMKYLYIGLLSSIVKCLCNRCRGTRVNKQVASRTSWLNLILKGPYIFSRMRFQQFTVNVFASFWHLHINGLVKYYSISISNALEILKSCTKPLIWTDLHNKLILNQSILCSPMSCFVAMAILRTRGFHENDSAYRWKLMICMYVLSSTIEFHLAKLYFYLYMEQLVHKVSNRVRQRRGHGVGRCVLPYSLGSVRYHRQSTPMFCQ